MITWLAVAPLLAVPGVLVFFAGVVPALAVVGQPVSGALVRQWCVNHLVLPVLPATDVAPVVHWYTHTGTRGEVLLHALVALNVNALLLVVLVPLAGGLIGVNNWAAKTNLDLKRRSAKR